MTKKTKTAKALQGNSKGTLSHETATKNKKTNSIFCIELMQEFSLSKEHATEPILVLRYKPKGNSETNKSLNDEMILSLDELKNLQDTINLFYKKSIITKE